MGEIHKVTLLFDHFMMSIIYFINKNHATLRSCSYRSLTLASRGFIKALILPLAD